jgi:hypothetical protein
MKTLEHQLADYGNRLRELHGPISAEELTVRLGGISEPTPVQPLHPMPQPARLPRRQGWLVALVSAAAVLVLIGGAAWLFPVDESAGPAFDSVAVVTPVGGWSRVPSDEAVFGGEGSQTIFSVTAGGPGVVAVGSDGGTGPWDVLGSDTDAAVWTSPDGFTWSRVTHDETVFGGEDGQVMRSVIVGGPGLVAVGWDGQGILADDPNLEAAIWTSVDGYTWSRVPHEDDVFGGAWIEAVTVGGPGLVAVGGTGGYNTGSDAAVWTSPDGFTWSRVPHDESVFGTDTGQFISDVTAGGPGLVAVGSGGGIGPWDHNNGTHAAVWTSVDGTTWSRVPNDDALLATGGNPAPMLSVAAGGPGLVAVGPDNWTAGQARTPVWTSPDGFTWTRVPDDEAVRGVMFDVIAGGPGLIAVGSGGGTNRSTPVVWTSVDGITWTPIPDDDDVTTLRSQDHMYSAIIQGPNLVIVGTDGSGTVPQRNAVVWMATLQD